MKQAWDSFLTVSDPISTVVSVSDGVVGAQRVVTVECVGLRLNFNVTVSYDTSGSISGLWLTNAVAPPSSPTSPSILQIVGLSFTVLLLAFLLFAFYKKELTEDQRAILRFITALCAAFAAATITGDALFKLTRDVGGNNVAISGAQRGKHTLPSMMRWNRTPVGVTRATVDLVRQPF